VRKVHISINTHSWKRYIFSWFIGPLATTDIKNFIFKNQQIPVDSDCFINILSFLDTSDIGSLSRVNSLFSKALKLDIIWEQLWLQKYLHLWSCDTISEIRRIRGGNLLWEGGRTKSAQISNSNRDSNRKKNSNPSPNAFALTPKQGWKKFVLEFDACWIDWLLSGINSRNYCLLGINNCIYNVTSFVDSHPGSPETLLDHAGGDCTETFYDIGHSIEALNMKRLFVICSLYRETGMRQYEHCSSPVASRSSLLSSSSVSTIGPNSSSISWTAGLQPTGASTTMRSSSPHPEQHQHRTLMGLYIRDFGKKLSQLALTSPNLMKLNPPQLMAMVAGHENCPLIQDATGTPPREGLRYMHHGQPRSCFDPVGESWYVWWTCCGQGQSVRSETVERVRKHLQY